MRPSAVLRPVGPERRGVYWRRRLVLLALVALVVVVALKVFGGGGGPSTTSAGGHPDAARPPTPTAPGVTPAPTGTTPTGTTPATPPASTPATASNACAAQQLATTAALSAHRYPAAAPVVVTVTVTNTGATGCVLDTGPASIVVSMQSGEIHSWANGDCEPATRQPVTLPAGGTHSLSITWDRYRSVPGCPSDVHAETAGAGTYTLDVAVLGRPVTFPPNAAVFQLA